MYLSLHVKINQHTRLVLGFPIGSSGYYIRVLKALNLVAIVYFVRSHISIGLSALRSLYTPILKKSVIDYFNRMAVPAKYALDLMVS